MRRNWFCPREYPGCNSPCLPLSLCFRPFVFALCFLPAAADFDPFALRQVGAAVAPGFLKIALPAPKCASHRRPGMKHVPRISLVIVTGLKTVQFSVRVDLVGTLDSGRVY